MRFTRVDAADPEAVASAARASADAFVLLVAPGAQPKPGALAALDAAPARTGVVGGVAETPARRDFGWMLGPSPGPLPFELVPVAGAHGDADADAAARGEIDVVTPGLVLAARELLVEPLPADPVAAMLELCARARAAGLEVVCRPALACIAGGVDDDDRGRLAAVRAVAERRPELVGTHRLTAAARRSTIDRETRMPGGLHVRVPRRIPSLTVLVHGAGAQLAARRARDLAPRAVARAVDDPVPALRGELAVRGDRYVLLAAADALPGRDAFDALVEAIESAACVALAAPSAAALDGACVLISASRVPQHVEPSGASLVEAMRALVDGVRAVKRAVRAPGITAAAFPRAARERSASVVVLASSLPEIMRVTLSAVVENTGAHDDVIAVRAANAATTRRLLEAYPQVRVVEDAVDPMLAGGANAAAASARGDVVVFIADDVLLPAGTLERLRAPFARVPALGAALPAVPGAPGGEGVADVQYGDLAELRALAARRAVERARDAEPIDIAVTPAIAVAREALHAVGGIDPAYGPTRRGIADLVLRLRAAGYAVVRCDDALVHRFTAEQSHSPAAAADARTPVPAADLAAIARGFDARRRVPLAAATAATPATASHALAVPVASIPELERAAHFLAAAAAAFDAGSPVRVHVLLDGDVTAADAAARMRAVLAASGKSLDATVSVRIERAPDLAAWLASLDDDVRTVVAAGHPRDAFASLRTVDRGALTRLLEPATR